MLRILHLEDDHLLAEEVQSDITKNLAEIRIERVCTESEFRNKLPNLVSNPPDLIIMDVMLRWTDPAPNMAPAPADVEKEGRFNAGVRCYKLLKEELLAQNRPMIPVLFYTVLEEAALAQFCQNSSPPIPYIQKTHDRSRLLGMVKALTKP